MQQFIASLWSFSLFQIYWNVPENNSTEVKYRYMNSYILQLFHTMSNIRTTETSEWNLIKTKVRLSMISSFFCVDETRSVWVNVSKARRASPRRPMTCPLRSGPICPPSVSWGKFKVPPLHFIQIRMNKWLNERTTVNVHDVRCCFLP